MLTYEFREIKNREVIVFTAMQGSKLTIQTQQRVMARAESGSVG